MRHELRALLLKEIDQIAAQHREYVADGKCATFEDYRKESGIIVGLKLSKTTIENAFERLKVDSEADQ